MLFRFSYVISQRLPFRIAGNSPLSILRCTVRGFTPAISAASRIVYMVSAFLEGVIVRLVSAVNSTSIFDAPQGV